jgi:hypothetical protein
MRIHAYNLYLNLKPYLNSVRTTDQLLSRAAATYESLKSQRQIYRSVFLNPKPLF